MAKLRWFAVGVLAGLMAAAIGRELEKEPDERTWKGTVAGVPYNLRLGEWGDIAHEYWNPESDAILSPRAIGLGWGINFAAVVRRVQSLIEARQGQPVSYKDELEHTPEPSRS